MISPYAPPGMQQSDLHLNIYRSPAPPQFPPNTFRFQQPSFSPVTYAGYVTQGTPYLQHSVNPMHSGAALVHPRFSAFRPVLGTSPSDGRGLVDPDSGAFLHVPHGSAVVQLSRNDNFPSRGDLYPASRDDRSSAESLVRTLKSFLLPAKVPSSHSVSSNDKSSVCSADGIDRIGRFPDSMDFRRDVGEESLIGQTCKSAFVFCRIAARLTEGDLEDTDCLHTN